MLFEQNNQIEKFGEKIGNLFAYFLFTTILFFILKLLNNIPNSWSYYNIMAITFVIVFVGIIIKRLLE